MKSRWNTVLPYLMISPYVFIYLLFILVPLIWVFYMSFTDYNPMKAGVWVGLKNYRQLLNDQIFHAAFRNTMVYWLFTVIPSMALGLSAAIFLNLKTRGVSLFRALIYLPGVMSGVAVAMTWLWLYNPRGGPINGILQTFGITGADWLRNTSTALPAVIVVGIWMGIGYCMIIYLAGLQGIPEQLYEAADIDGASRGRQFISITVPLLKPITFFLFIICTINSFQVFDIVYVMTGGGPANRTNTIVNEIVSTGFRTFNMGYASTIAIFLLLITFLFTAVNYKMNSKQSDLA